MTTDTSTHVAAPFQSDAVATAALNSFASHRLFTDIDTWEHGDRPYHRSLRPQALASLNLSSQLTAAQLTDYEALAAHRVLTTVYEQDLVFLPREPYDDWRTDFDAFYSPNLVDAARVFRSRVESYCFEYLDEYVQVSDNWTSAMLEEYLESSFAHAETESSSAFATITSSADPVRAAKMWLIQLAPDFLSESSPMLRNVLGNFGEEQSEWFKIIIDEYGAGVHANKHSYLFEKTLQSVGLSADIHNYWQFYLATALAANNYFHYLGGNHSKLFRYIGALVYTETSLVKFCIDADKVLNEVFAGTSDNQYFTEHIHIDRHHGQMAWDKVCRPLIDRFGEEIIPEIVRGIEEYRAVMDSFDSQFARQIAWMDDQDNLKIAHDGIFEAVSCAASVPRADIDEPFNELSNTHCHNQDELCHIIAGKMEFWSGFGSSITLEAGDGVVIRNRCQHGADILSADCQYQIYTIGSFDKWQ